MNFFQNLVINFENVISLANCNQPAPILRATVDTSAGTLEGNIAVYSCTGSTVQEGFGETVCQKDGTWTPVDMYCRRKSINLFIN